MTDDQLQADFQTLRAHFEAATARLCTETTTLSNDVQGQLLTAEKSIARRLDASDVRLPALADIISLIEQQLPYVNAALEQLRVVRPQTDQLGAPTSEKYAPLEAIRAEVRQAYGHAQAELLQVIRERDAEKGT